MEIFHTVILKCIELFSVELTFSPFTFSIGDAFIGLAGLSLTITFLVKLFDR